MSENIKVAWIGFFGVISVAGIGLIPLFFNYDSKYSVEKTISTSKWVCVEKPHNYNDPLGGCDIKRGDVQFKAGEIKSIEFPINAGLIPKEAKVIPKINVTGGTNFHLFKNINAEYRNGNIFLTVTPNEHGGFNDNLIFTITYRVKSENK